MNPLHPHPAKPLPPRPRTAASGPLLTFGKYNGWSVGEVGAVDPRYLTWLCSMPGVRRQPNLYRAVRVLVIAILNAEGEAELEDTFG
jgi:hypothetical protein